MENTKQEQRKHIVALWVERAEKEKDISIFDLISTNCDYLNDKRFLGSEKEMIIQELCYFIHNLLKGYATSENDFINQLKEYRCEEFFASDEE